MRWRLPSLLLLFAAPSPGAVVDGDDRIAVARPDARLLPIGIVKGGKRVAYATGFLVDDCHVLTVKHAAGQVASVAGRRMRFRLPFAGRDGASAGSVVAAGALDLVGDANRLDRREDWLLLKLDRCLGARFGHLDLGADDKKPGPFRTLVPNMLSSAGFPIDRSWRRQLTVDPQCRVRAVAGAVMIHDCSSLPGNSGSPIFATTRRGGRTSIQVVAMHSTASRALPGRGDGRGVATLMADVWPAIRGYLAPPSALAERLAQSRLTPPPAAR